MSRQLLATLGASGSRAKGDLSPLLFRATMDNQDNADAYRDLLIRNGLNEAMAASIASKTDAASRQRALDADRPGPVETDSDLTTSLAPPSSSIILDKTAKPAKRVRNVSSPVETVDFRSAKGVPAWIREVINTHLAIEAEDAKSAGSLGFMSRALVIATMPYKDQKNPDGTPKESFTRQNGDFRLRILAGYEGGLPFGIYPRLLMSWVSTEAVRNQSPIIELGDSLRIFLRDVMDLRGSSGGARGTSTRVTEQLKRLFGSLITAQYSGSNEDRRNFVLKNVLIADELELDPDEVAAMDADDVGPDALWRPQANHEAGKWQSKVKLTTNFFQECIKNPVPIDLRAYKGLRGSPLAMDLYTWLTYRMSYVQNKTRPIPWESLMLQFGTGFGGSTLLLSNEDEKVKEEKIKQAVRDFKKAFLKALKLVLIVYPAAKVDVSDTGLTLFPSPTHIPSIGRTAQRDLFGSG